jgi:hypothetical protein
MRRHEEAGLVQVDLVGLVFITDNQIKRPIAVEVAGGKGLGIVSVAKTVLVLKGWAICFGPGRAKQA